MSNKTFLKTIVGRSDSYKYSHYKQYPSDMENNNSYIESRGVEPPMPIGTEVVFFGLQAFLMEYMSQKITLEDVNRVEKMILAHGEPFNRQGWIDIVNKFDGRLPLVIEAVPEGTVMKPGNVMVQVRATQPGFGWLVSFAETAILRGVWYPSTVATLSRETKKIIKKYVDETVDPEVRGAVLPFRLHDFGARGVASAEAAELGGMAHLVNFMGTDTAEALFAAEEYYGADGPVGFSIPASEHSTMTSWGMDREADAYENMLKQYAAPGAIVACVSDSYDFENAVENIWGGVLKDKVLQSGATLVVRPDSGDVVQTILFALESLGKNFGFTMNSMGYKVLNPAVRIIQGDGLNITSIRLILEKMKLNGWSAENVAFGMGGGLLQKINRDTLRFSMKTSAIKTDDGWVNIHKQPVGTTWKKSKEGILSLVRTTEGELKTIPRDSLGDQEDLLKVVWENGFIKRTFNFEDVRKNTEL